MDQLRRISAILLTALLVLSGCTSSNLKDERDQLRADNERLRAAPAADPQTERKLEEAEAALAELRGLLADAQGSLEPGTPTEQREGARMAVASARDNLVEVRRTLEMQPDSAAKTAADEALAAVGTALTAVDEALRDTAPAMSAGLLSFANMHTTLDRAQAAVDDALAKLKQALAADPGDTVASLLTQARVTLSTAQLSLIPLLREELAESEGERDAAQAAREAAEGARQAAEGERDAAQAAREAAEGARQAAEGERDAAQAAREAAEDLASRRTLTLPAGLSAADAGGPAEFTVEAGGRTFRARVEFRCPAGGDACRVRVYDNGEIGYWGGLPTVWPNPPRSALWADLEPGVWRASVLGEVSVRRVPRLNQEPIGMAKPQTVANPDPLAVATEGVAWAAGKTITRPTGELPLRVLTRRGTTDVQGRHNTGRFGEERWRETDANLESSIELREDGGVVLKVRGEPGEGLNYNDMKIDPNLLNVAGPDGKYGEIVPGQRDAIAGDVMSLHNAFDLGFSPEESIRLIAANTQLTKEQADRIRDYRLDNCNQRSQPRAEAGFCYDANMADLEITFGKSSGDPARGPVAYWSARVPFENPDEVIDSDYALLYYERNTETAGRTRTYHDYGRYDLYLSRYAGPDPGTDADTAADDTHRYLRYAAYGLFHFFDNRVQWPHTERVQAFHFGFDAFRDAEGARTADLPRAIQATFKGRTMGWDLRGTSDFNRQYYRNPGARPSAFSEFTSFRGFIGPMVRIRGDVHLHACIGGSGAGACPGGDPVNHVDRITGATATMPLPTAANTINGVLNNFEFFHPETEHWWKMHGQDLSFVRLVGEGIEGSHPFHAPIAADGSFRGVAIGSPRSRWVPPDPSANDDPDYYEFGEYSGMLYGPRNDPEVAGWWNLSIDYREIPVDQQHNLTVSVGLIGSFGARCTEGC